MRSNGKARQPVRDPGRLIVGIDCGGTPRTGVAVYDTEQARLEECRSVGFWQVVRFFATCLRPVSEGGPVAYVVIEDPRRLPIFARHDQVRGRRRDALARKIGRIDRDVALWVEGLEAWGYEVVLSVPGRVKKWTAQDLRRITGWEGRTNEHGRDAARLVWGRSQSLPEGVG